MHPIIEAEARAGFSVWVKFGDGVEGSVDLSHLAGRGVFQVWSDRGLFEKVHPGPGGSLAWPGEVEIDPDQIYMSITGKAVEELFPRLIRQPVDA